jgi:2-amino-4-hydroxy-6-hydroxymethyldihydropteridine diphosphokinase
VIACRNGAADEVSRDDELTVPHPHAHERAFVLIPWLAVEPAATLMVDGNPRPITALLAGLDPGERDGVRPTGLVLAT